MIIKKRELKPAWHPTVDLFGEMTPQPEIQIRPLRWQERAELTEAATDIKMVPHPSVSGRFLQAERIDQWKFSRLIILKSVVGLKHFEYPDGTSIPANAEGLEYLMTELGADFVASLHLLIKQVSDEAEHALKDYQEDTEKNS